MKEGVEKHWQHSRCRHRATAPSLAKTPLANRQLHAPSEMLNCCAVSARMRLVTMASGAAFTPACGSVMKDAQRNT
jgi:hypothetical protein